MAMTMAGAAQSLIKIDAEEMAMMPTPSLIYWRMDWIFKRNEFGYRKIWRKLEKIKLCEFRVFRFRVYSGRGFGKVIVKLKAWTPKEKTTSLKFRIRWLRKSIWMIRASILVWNFNFSCIILCANVFILDLTDSETNSPRNSETEPWWKNRSDHQGIFCAKFSGGRPRPDFPFKYNNEFGVWRTEPVLRLRSA